jgi:hypothetical protein
VALKLMLGLLALDCSLFEQEIKVSIITTIRNNRMIYSFHTFEVITLTHQATIKKAA